MMMDSTMASGSGRGIDIADLDARRTELMDIDAAAGDATAAHAETTRDVETVALTIKPPFESQFGAERCNAVEHAYNPEDADVNDDRDEFASAVSDDHASISISDIDRAKGHAEMASIASSNHDNNHESDVDTASRTLAPRSYTFDALEAFRVRSLATLLQNRAPLPVASKVGVCIGDITKLPVDCIVNAANEALRGGGGVDGAIHRAAGPQLLEELECFPVGSFRPGQAVLTNGHELPARYVLHTAGPKDQDEDVLRSCYDSCLQLARDNDDIRSVAFCCVGTGIYGYPNEEACHVALHAVTSWLRDSKNCDSVDTIVFCLFAAEDIDAYQKILPMYFAAPAAGHGADDVVELEKDWLQSALMSQSDPWPALAAALHCKSADVDSSSSSSNSSVNVPRPSSSELELPCTRTEQLELQLGTPSQAATVPQSRGPIATLGALLSRLWPWGRPDSSDSAGKSLSPLNSDSSAAAPANAGRSSMHMTIQKSSAGPLHTDLVSTLTRDLEAEAAALCFEDPALKMSTRAPSYRPHSPANLSAITPASRSGPSPRARQDAMEIEQMETEGETRVRGRTLPSNVKATTCLDAYTALEQERKLDGSWRTSVEIVRHLQAQGFELPDIRAAHKSRLEACCDALQKCLAAGFTADDARIALRGLHAVDNISKAVERTAAVPRRSAAMAQGDGKMQEGPTANAPALATNPDGHSAARDRVCDTDIGLHASDNFARSRGDWPYDRSKLPASRSSVVFDRSIFALAMDAGGISFAGQRTQHTGPPSQHSSGNFDPQIFAIGSSRLFSSLWRAGTDMSTDVQSRAHVARGASPQPSKPSESRLRGGSSSVASSASSSGTGKAQREQKKDVQGRVCRNWRMGFCRLQNIRFVKERCPFLHPATRQGAESSANWKRVELYSGALYDDLRDKFLQGFQRAKVHKIHRIVNPVMLKRFEDRKTCIMARHSSGSKKHATFSDRYYHGTRVSNLERIYKEGFVPPADFCAAADCPRSRGLPDGSPSLCDVNCRKCTSTKCKQHVWSRCHMFGLGTYFAEDASKSDQYVVVSNAAPKTRKILVCKLALGNPQYVSRDLQRMDEMHNRILPNEGFDSVIVQGRSNATPSLGVRQTEIIIFHPFQALPEFEIEYEV